MSIADLFALQGVHYGYRGVAALDGISLSIPAGSRSVLLGANGSGKSTLLRVLAALYFAQRGEARAFGQLLTAEAFADDAQALVFRRRVGLVFQNAEVQLFNPTVFDELAFGPLQLGWEKQRVREAVEHALQDMELEHLRDRSPHRLSGGEQKRVALASVLVTDPDVLLLDEPLSGLDPKSQSQIIDLLVGWRGSGKTVITATHDLGLITDIADEAYVLHQGTLLARGAPADILADMALLRRARLVHAHRHVHADGSVHSHPHLHGHGHPHAQAGGADRD
ncbi:ABC transporter ATP-binding protein [Castellaniella sp.]|uniref:energy-coupling factor ABC transporter ATP-binding protein n=1 Tax=Castellaniella sp. TaxID=1955812 RepID=UPI002B002E5D|nr:ABC transporter ATP-binding protein [Castellaniella sp.]